VVEVSGGEALMARPEGALVTELARAWNICGSATVNRLQNGMAAGTIFCGVHVVSQSRRYFSSAAARDAWQATAGRLLTTPIQAKAQQMIADGRAYLTAMELAEAFGGKVQLATNALSRMANHGALHKVSCGRRMFFFINAEAAARYPAHLIERHAAELIKKAAQRKNAPTPAQNQTMVNKRQSGKVAGDVIISAGVTRTFATTPLPRFHVPADFKGAFSLAGIGRDVQTGKAWGERA